MAPLQMNDHTRASWHSHICEVSGKLRRADRFGSDRLQRCEYCKWKRTNYIDNQAGVIMNFGIQALLNLFVHLAVLILTFWALHSMKIDVFFRHPKSLQARILFVLLAIAISYPVARFFLDYINWSISLPLMYD